MGGRIGCHVSLEEKVEGLVCLGYPLCAMGDRTKLRDEVLRALTTPILFCARHARFAMSAGSAGAGTDRNENGKLFARG